MHTSLRIPLVILFCLAPAAALAQRPTPYVSLGVSGFRLSSDNLDGRSAGPEGTVGVDLLPWLSVEGSLFHPGTIDEVRVGPTRSFAGPGASREEIERLAIVERLSFERRGRPSFSAAAVFHPTGRHRVMPALVAGVTWHRFLSRETREVVHIPDGVDPDAARPNPPLWETSHTRSYPTIGAKLTVALTDRVAIVPDIRYDFGSFGDEIDNVLRTSIRAEWRF